MGMKDLMAKIAGIKSEMRKGNPYIGARKKLDEAVKAISKHRASLADRLLDEALYMVRIENKIRKGIKSLNRKVKNSSQSYCRKLLNDIKKNLEKGDVLNAEKLYKEIIKRIDREDELWKNLDALDSLIEKRQAGADIEMAKTYRRMAIESISCGDYKKAEESIRQGRIYANPSVEFLLENAKNYADEGEKLYEETKYDDAIDRWRKAMEYYDNAMNIARERNDMPIVERIREIMKDIGERIKEAERRREHEKMRKFIDKGNEYVGEANDIYEKAEKDLVRDLYVKAKEFYIKGIEEYKNALEIANKNGFEEKGEIENQINVLDQSVILCDIGVEKVKMKEAEELYRKEEYYESRQRYNESLNSLDRIEEKAIKMQNPDITRLLEELKSLASENTKKCVDMLLKPPGKGKAPPIRKVKFVAGVTPSSPIGSEINMIEVRKELGERYEIEELVGSGATSDVYKCRKKDGSIVALKVITRWKIDPEVRRNFVSEVEKWKTIWREAQRNIVQIYYYDTVPFGYIEMEYLKMAEKMAPMDWRKAASVMMDVAIALYVAHRMKPPLIHMDVKPSNIFIDSEMRGKIGDWGLAQRKFKGGFEKLGGTLIYVAPEILEGGYVDEKCDIYSWGATLVYLITGSYPFSGDEEEIRKRKREESVILNNSNIPKELRDLIAECTNPDPSQRPANMMQVAKKLSDMLGKPINIPVGTSTLVVGDVLISDVKNYSNTRNYLSMARKMAKTKELKTEIERILVEMELVGKDSYPNNEELQEKIKAIADKLRRGY